MTTAAQRSQRRIGSAVTHDSVNEVALIPDGRRIVTGGDWLQLTSSWLQTTSTDEDVDAAEADDVEISSLAGSYRCRAANVHGQVEMDIQLDVRRQLRVQLEPRRQVNIQLLIDNFHFKTKVLSVSKNQVREIIPS